MKRTILKVLLIGKNLADCKPIQRQYQHRHFRRMGHARPHPQIATPIRRHYGQCRLSQKSGHEKSSRKCRSYPGIFAALFA